MGKNIWDEREKAFEDKYFHDLEREQLRKLREKVSADDTEAKRSSTIPDPISGNEKS